MNHPQYRFFVLSGDRMGVDRGARVCGGFCWQAWMAEIAATVVVLVIVVLAAMVVVVVVVMVVMVVVVAGERAVEPHRSLAVGSGTPSPQA